VGSDPGAYAIVEADNGDAHVEFRPEVQSPEISALLLREIKEFAEEFLGRRSRRRSSPCRHTSTTASVRPPRTRNHRRARGGADHQ